MSPNLLPGLGGCAHRNLEFDVTGTALPGSNIVIASMRARCSSCKKMMKVQGLYPVEATLHQATLSPERDMILVPMVADGEKPRYPPTLVITDAEHGPQTA
jgi:hypothetical protein